MALCAAAGSGHTKTVELLLQFGADVNGNHIVIYENDAPLIAASEGGHTATVKLLLNRGADITETRNRLNVKLALRPDSNCRVYGETALLVAVSGLRIHSQSMTNLQLGQ